MTDVAYIGGLGRSGSTLLERIAGRLDGVCVLGEVVHLWERGVRRDELCSCGEPFSQCAFWQAVGDTAFGGWQRVDVDRVLELAALVDRTRHIPAAATARPSSAHAARMVEYGEYFAAVYDAARKTANARVVVDSSKHPSTAYILRRQPGVDLRVVHLVRDSRGVAYSWTKVVARPEAREGNAEPTMHRYPPWRAAVLWNAHNSALAAMARTSTPVWRLHYETLLADPVASVRRLMTFLELPDQPIEEFVSEQAVRVGPAHQIAGNYMRFQTGELPLHRDDAWRTQMPITSQRLVTALTAPQLLRYGYLSSAEPRRERRQAS